MLVRIQTLLKQNLYETQTVARMQMNPYPKKPLVETAFQIQTCLTTNYLRLLILNNITVTKIPNLICFFQNNLPVFLTAEQGPSINPVFCRFLNFPPLVFTFPIPYNTHVPLSSYPLLPL